MRDIKTFTQEEQDKAVMIDDEIIPGAEMCEDNQGQLVLYTGMFQWGDGTVRSQPDPNYEEL